MGFARCDSAQSNTFLFTFSLCCLYTFFMKRPVALSLLSLAVLFTVALAGTLPSQKGASIAGTWKLDVGKSKYSTGSLPKSAIRKVEAQSDGETTTCEEVEADGS